MKKTICSLLITGCVVIPLGGIARQAFGAGKGAGHLKTSTTSAITLGYTPSAGSGLTLNLSSGSVYCNGAVRTYSGGSLTMKAASTNYVYVSPSSSCVPTSGTSGFPGGSITVARVATDASSVTSVTDMRAMVMASGISGAGACASNQFVTAVNTATGPTCAQPSFSNLSGSAAIAQLPVAATGLEGILQLAGDLGGTAAAPTVAGLQGHPVSTTAPTTNQVLTWNGSAWAASTPATGGAGAGNCGSNQFVTGTNAGSAPTCAQPAFSNLSGTASAAQLPSATGSTQGAVELAGDLGGTAGAPSVAGLQGHAVSTTAPATNQVLTWNGSAWEPATPTAGGGISGSGLISGNVAVASSSGSLTSYSGFTTDNSGNITANSYTGGGSGVARIALGTAATAPTVTAGAGAPSNSCSAGSIFLRVDGGAGTTLYVCEGGTWAAK